MSRTVLFIAAALSGAVSAASADTVISMPLPPSFSAQVPSAGIKALSASMTAQVTGSNTDDKLFQDGIDSLERYSAREGRTRNHYLPNGFVSAGGFRVGFSGPYYSSYEGPWGWGGWWGSPIFVNNYFCGKPHTGGPRPRWFGPGYGVCGVGSYTAIGGAGF